MFVESELGRGSTFEIYLPRADGKLEHVAPPSEVLRSALRTRLPAKVKLHALPGPGVMR